MVNEIDPLTSLGDAVSSAQTTHRVLLMQEASASQKEDLVHGPRWISVPPEVAKAIIYQIKAYHE